MSLSFFFFFFLLFCPFSHSHSHPPSTLNLPLQPLSLPLYRRSLPQHRLADRLSFERQKLILKYSHHSHHPLHKNLLALHPRQLAAALPPIPLSPNTSAASFANFSQANTSSRSPTTYRGLSDGSGGVVGLQRTLNFQADLEYFTSIAIGSPPQTLNVILDTGSSDLWLASANCSLASGCSPSLGPRFDPRNSSSALTANTAFSIKYGSGSATGKMYTDNMTFAGYNISAQSFAVVDTVTSELLSKDVSGLLGLGFQPLASSGVMPIWQSLITNGTAHNITFPGFSFALTRFINTSHPAEVEPGGLFTLGTLNASLIAPGEAINFVAVPQGLQSYWLIPMDAIMVNGNSVELNSQQTSNVAIDTGTTLIGGPAEEVRAFYSHVQGATPASGSYQGYYSYPCNSSVLIMLTFGGHNYSMTSEDFNLGPFGAGGRCLGSVFELELSGASRALISWVIGDSFLKNVLSVYRYIPPAVGFARLSSTTFNSTNVAGIYPNGVLYSPQLLNTTEASGGSGGAGGGTKNANLSVGRPGMEHVGVNVSGGGLGIGGGGSGQGPGGGAKKSGAARPMVMGKRCKSGLKAAVVVVGGSTVITGALEIFIL